ncbi:MAG: hypothetical protein ACC655_11830, partial [Rhodothermia bacterium]
MKPAHYPERDFSRFNLAVLFIALLTFYASPAVAQWTGPNAPDSLSFQGFLADTSGAVVPDGNYDLLFKMYKSSSKVWEENHLNVAVKSGGFDVILSGTTSFPLDTVAFNGPIDLGITVNGGTELTPRTPLTSAAYALGMRGMYAVWADDGIGRAPNLIGGASNNYVAGSVVGATIGGGGGWWNTIAMPDSVLQDWGTVSGGRANTAGALASTVGGGDGNTVGGYASTVGGGASNSAGGYASTVSGGRANTASAHASTVGGGDSNSAGAINSTVGGGGGNTAGAYASTVGGGDDNQARGRYSTVPGGRFNVATKGYSFAAGSAAKAYHPGTFVWADSSS